MAIELAQTVDVNLVAVLVAAAAAVAVGAVWYSQPLFGKQWRKMVLAWTKMSEKSMKETAASAMIGGAFCNLVLAYALAYFFGLLEVGNASEGVAVAAWVAVGFVATVTLMNALFHGERKKLWLINIGHSALSLVAMGAILGAWQ